MFVLWHGQLESSRACSPGSGVSKTRTPVQGLFDSGTTGSFLIPEVSVSPGCWLHQHLCLNKQFHGPDHGGNGHAQSIPPTPVVLRIRVATARESQRVDRSRSRCSCFINLMIPRIQYPPESTRSQSKSASPFRGQLPSICLVCAILNTKFRDEYLWMCGRHNLPQ